MIQERRLRLWNTYLKELGDWANEHSVSLPVIPNFASNNAHMFYIVFKDLPSRDKIIAQLKSKSILSVFHYLSLHKSPYHLANNPLVDLPNSDHYSDCLIRLPFYYELTDEQIYLIVSKIKEFFSR
jgi:dTDP-4-amino-4,6-dideoxygalactose transaminase